MYINLWHYYSHRYITYVQNCCVPCIFKLTWHPSHHFLIPGTPGWSFKAFQATLSHSQIADRISSSATSHHFLYLLFALNFANHGCCLIPLCCYPWAWVATYWELLWDNVDPEEFLLYVCLQVWLWVGVLFPPDKDMVGIVSECYWVVIESTSELPQ